MLTNEDKETLRYLKQSSDALKRDAVRLIERLNSENYHATDLINELAEILNVNQAA